MCCARREGPRTLSSTSFAYLEYAFVENTLILVVPDIGGSRAPLGALLYDSPGMESRV